MNDLISRQVAIGAIDAMSESLKGVFIEYQDIAEKCINKLQSAEPKKGKWIDETFKPWGLVYHPYKCDQCGEHSEATSNFCPWCGAKMEADHETD